MSEQPTINPTVECTANTVPVVPEDWAALGTKGGYDPKPVDRLRLFVVGPSGEGKTTFLASIPRNHILDFEKGAWGCTLPRANRTEIKSYDHFMQLRNRFVADAQEGKRHWDRVTFDTIDECVAVIKQQLEKEKGVEDITEYRSDGYGYNLIVQRLWSIVLDLEQAGYTWAFGGHLKTKTEINAGTQKPESKIREGVYPGVAAKIRGQSDFKLTVYCLPTEVITEGPSRSITQGGKQIILPGVKTSTVKKVYWVDSFSTSERDNKTRGVPSMDCKFELPLVGGWDEFKKRYDLAVAAERAKYQS